VTREFAGQVSTTLAVESCRRGLTAALRVAEVREVEVFDVAEERVSEDLGLLRAVSITMNIGVHKEYIDNQPTFPMQRSLAACSMTRILQSLVEPKCLECEVARRRHRYLVRR